MELSRETILNVYRNMVMSRRYEETVNTMYREKKVEEKPLSGVGQEAVSVCMTQLLREDDYAAPTLRSKGVFFAKGVTAEQCFLQLFRRKDSQSGGVWTSHHLGDMKKGLILSSAIVASSLSVATGVALAAKLRKTGQVVVAFVGEGASSRGDFHTAINFAAAMDLPIVFVCENNLYALSTHISQQMKNPNVADRAIGYGIPGKIVDGQDAVAVLEAADAAIRRAREGKGPSLVECKTYRFRGHTESHDPDDGRPEEELALMRSRCPILLFEKYIQRETDIEADELEKIRRSVEEEIAAAVEKAQASPLPEALDFEALVFAK